MPGPSEDPDRIRKFYTAMPDATILRHVRAMLDEISKRPDLDIPIPLDAPVIPECVPMEMVDPKTELEDEDYLEVHHNSTGIEYNYEDDAYSYHPRFGGNQTDLIKRVNTLNQYGARRRLELEAEEDSEDQEESSESRSSSPARPVRRASRDISVFRSSGGTVPRGRADLPVVNCECSICSAPFTTICALLNHRREAHSEADMLTCGICQKVFGTRTQMSFHMTQEYKVHHCTNCQTSFASNWHLGKHVCQLSRKRMSEVLTRDEGSESDEGARLQAGEDAFKCVRCGKQYMHLGWLEKHQSKCDKIKKEEEEELDEGAETPNLKCDICLRVYTSPFWFETHKKKCNASTPTPPVVLPGKPTARCQVCGKMFQNERSLEFHKRHCRAKQQRLERQRMAERDLEGAERDRKIQGAEPKVYVTRSNRGVVTRNRINLKEDSEESSDEEDEDEEEEEEEANSDDEKKKKKNTVEEEEEEKDQKPFQPVCSICNQRCSGVINLISHRRSAHGTEAMLTCGICQSKFNSQSSITRHMNMEYSLYVCKKCGRNCHDSTVLRQHVCSSTCRPWNYHLGRRRTMVSSSRSPGWASRSSMAMRQRGDMIPRVARSPDTPRTYHFASRRSPQPMVSRPLSPPQSPPPDSPKIVTVTTALQKALLLDTPTLSSSASSRHQQGTLKCPDCLEMFATSFILYNHRMSCDPKRLQLQPTTSTASTSSSSGSGSGSGSAPSSAGRTRTDTIRTTDSADETLPIKCPECHQEFMYLREVAHHRFTRHGKEEFECLHCPKSFALLRTLGDHWNLELKRWKCESCNRYFTRRYLLNDHLQRDGCEHD